MTKPATATSARRPALREFGLVALLLIGLLVFLFRDALASGHTLFSNDGPLGAIRSQCADPAHNFSGLWQDLNWLGTAQPSALPDISVVLCLTFGPLVFSKIYALTALFIAGIGAWLFFKQSKLAPMACVLGALAAALNSVFFTVVCWGTAGQTITVGLCFLALAALVSDNPRHRWIKAALAGLAVGMAVMEGFDIGAIFSVFVAAFALVHTLAFGEGSPVKKLAKGVARIAVVAVFAVFIAAQALSTLVGTQIKGVAKSDQGWDWATQWSLAKRETLGLFIPGLFGERMDTPNGGVYWGLMGRDPAWDRYFADIARNRLRAGEILSITFPGAPNLNTAQQVSADGEITLPTGKIKVLGMSINELQQEILKRYSAQLPSKEVTVSVIPPQGFIRYAGGSDYTGILVALVAFWAVFQSFRKDSVFTLPQRKLLWFLSGTLIFSLLLAFGRHAPFYRFFYELPFSSTIRNPAKFLRIFDFAMLILFGYGVHGLSRRYLETALAPAAGFGARLRNWWTKAAALDKRWVAGCAFVIVASVIGWLIYAAARPAFERYLQTVQFDESMAREIAAYSIRHVGWFILFLTASMALVTLIMTGALAGRRAKAAGILLGLLLVVDLTRADIPFIIAWNYKIKYETDGPNPIIQFLREKPYEHRVAQLPFRPPPQVSLFKSLYDIEWLQQLFPYYNIQSLDIVQMSRRPEDLLAFESALGFNGSPDKIYLLTRRWELTNTRYLLGPAGYFDILNQQVDPVLHRFRIAEPFDLGLKPGFADFTGDLTQLTAYPTNTGTYAVFEFTGALPRAKLYAHWQVNTNDEDTLNELASRSFDPAETVLVVSTNLDSTSSGATNRDAGTVEFSSYSPKDIVLKANAKTASVLLLNDHYDPNWHVLVDGRTNSLLRCNYLMRGVYLTPGDHIVEFHFRTPTPGLYVSLAAIVVGIALGGVLVFSKVKPVPAPNPPKPKSPATTLAKK